MILVHGGTFVQSAVVEADMCCGRKETEISKRQKYQNIERIRPGGWRWGGGVKKRGCGRGKLLQ